MTQSVRDALELAANRLHRCAADHTPGSRKFIETAEWAEEARAALATPPVEAEPVAWVVLLRYGEDRWSGEMLTDVLPKDDRNYKMVRPLFTHPPAAQPPDDIREALDPDNGTLPRLIAIAGASLGGRAPLVEDARKLLETLQMLAAQQTNTEPRFAEALSGDRAEMYAAIRICPERDGPCPHGMSCAFTVDRYHCDIAGSRAALKSGSGQ
jgi:hypothetical protein